jgi:hypothetical protein
VKNPVKEWDSKQSLLDQLDEKKHHVIGYFQVGYSISRSHAIRGRVLQYFNILHLRRKCFPACVVWPGVRQGISSPIVSSAPLLDPKNDFPLVFSFRSFSDPLTIPTEVVFFRSNPSSAVTFKHFSSLHSKADPPHSPPPPELAL